MFIEDSRSYNQAHFADKEYEAKKKKKETEREKVGAGREGGSVSSW